jgi:DNA adenine methylase
MPRPFLKWAGGKGQLLSELLERVGQAEPFRAYHEPFVGGGALFFELARQGRMRGEVFLSDTNPNLVETYVAVRDEVGELIELLRAHEARHGETYFYELRALVPGTAVERAARIVYLNTTCYNGLFRENRKGQFNVPFGRYESPAICDEPNLRAASEALQGCRIESRAFDTVLREARKGDLVYLDPPYDPVSRTASFTAYSKERFAEPEQRRLAAVYAQLAGRGVKALLSNSMTERVRELYRQFTVETVLAGRSVNSKAGRRGKVPEALVRNF